jgi:hypothetical protein
VGPTEPLGKCADRLIVLLHPLRLPAHSYYMVINFSDIIQLATREATFRRLDTLLPQVKSLLSYAQLPELVPVSGIVSTRHWLS